MPAVAHRYFNVLHQTLSEQYQPCNCESCKNVRLNLANNPKKKNNFKNVLNTAEKAFKKLFKEKKYKPEQLFEINEYKELVKATADTFNQAIPHEVSNELRSYLEQDVFVFSGLKTHAQLTEARSYLKNKDGITPYHEFEQKVLKLNKKYNRHYLEAEYEFAVQSAQSADQWNNLEENDERYWLQYRTAKDDRVRVSHQALHGTTLPKTDPFWNEFYPPNGWRCRCVAVEVLARNNEKSNSKKAVEKGRLATSQINKNGKNKLAMFRFNPGKNKKVFPPKNSYSKVIGADRVKKEIEKSTQNVSHINSDFENYLKENNIHLNTNFVNAFKKPVTFRGGRSSYFQPKRNLVTIDRKDKTKRIIYHEFGHALDEHNNFNKNVKTAKLMNKYINHYKGEGFKKLDSKVKGVISKNDTEKAERSAFRDTIMALNPNYGQGHTKAYYREKGANNRQREFIAHAFENKFVGNELFKKHAPELYEDMINLVDELIAEIK